jgi:predicted acetyltransferase
VARDLVSYFLEYYRNKGVNMLLLYPFRVDSYRKMGFGYGTKVYQYRAKPESFPRGSSKNNLKYLDKDDSQAVLECYLRYMDKTNGLLERSLDDTTRSFSSGRRMVGYFRDGKVQGYVLFSFRRAKPENASKMDLVVNELVYETPEALTELCMFLNSKSDQVNRVELETYEDTFNFLLSDPSNGFSSNFNTERTEICTAGMSVMYRVINVQGIFRDLEAHNFGGESCTLKVTVRDSFFKSNDGSTIVCFDKGSLRLTRAKEYDTEITMDVSDFSSMIAGAVDFKTLYRYGLAGISDIEYLDKVNRLFSADQKPMCLTGF